MSATRIELHEREPAVLVLESGRVFRGWALGARGRALGEAVFNTAMTGYQEILTDPSYAGQIVVMTSPQIGNTGVNHEDEESRRPYCAGFVVREASPVVSSWRAHGSMQSYLAAHGIVGIEGIDTRALTRALRTDGAQRALIATGAFDQAGIAALCADVRGAPSMEGRDLASEVTCASPYVWPRDRGQGGAPDGSAAVAPGLAGRGPVLPASRRWHVVAYDFGIKQNILACLEQAGCRVTVVPAGTSARDALEIRPDGFFLSNGPGDPAAVGYAIDTVKALIDAGKPLFGICLGHQLLGLALGARTYKLRFGHHGGNHPVQDLTTGKIEITSHNHGFAVDETSLPAGVRCTHRNLYDGTVEGIEVAGRPVFAIQYHPEAAPGPHDAVEHFRRFTAAMEDAGPEARDDAGDYPGGAR
jgi:carbamoyl-phosphate synthase small subunit